MSFKVAHLDYLQRTDIGVVGLDLQEHRMVGLGSLRRLWQIRGVGVAEKQIPRVEGPEARLHMPTLDFLMGLNGVRIPIAFLVRGESDTLSVGIGTWMASGTVGAPEQAERIVNNRNQVLKAALQSTFRTIEAEEINASMNHSEAAGIVIGIPTVKAPDPADGALPIDRLASSLRGTSWGCLVLAEPILQSVTVDLRLNAVEELKNIQFYLKALSYPDPLAQYYGQLLEATVGDYTYGIAVGSWRTSVYLMGNESGYSRLSAIWQGLFSGDYSLHMPIRIGRHPIVSNLAADWKMLDSEAQKGPGLFRHHFAYQTVLTSDQLAAYIHLPRLETRGFTVKVVPDFDVVPEPVDSTRAVEVGKVVERTKTTEIPYLVSTRSLSGHVFVTGVTGSGKTNTVFHLLREAVSQNIGFLVIEPAKSEYRSLLGDPIVNPDLRVFTVGNEQVAPLRLNPFEIQRGVQMSVHLDLLRSVFASSFGMWVPMPQVLEKCLVAIYEDRGWDIATSQNRRLDGGNWDSSAFPTLSDLVVKIEEVVPGLGFDREAESRILASLTSRINGLRAGGKGTMLDAEQSVGIEELLQHPTILELEAVGDDDDKAFIIGLLLIRLIEYRRLNGPRELQHMLVIEEAHRILTNVARNSNQEQSDPRGKAVETFTNLLSEIRAYGQGVVIADQVPSRLAPDVIKNTNLKIAHRIVAGDDREVLAKAMAMSNRQAAALSSLKRGQAAVFSGENDDSPILVAIAKVKGDPGTGDISPNEVCEKMSEKYFKGPSRHLFRQTPACEKNCPATESSVECRLAATILESPSCRAAVGRFALSIIENPTTADSLWEDVRATVAPKRVSGCDEQGLYRCLAVRSAAWLASRRGAQSGWSFHDTKELERTLRNVLFALIGQGNKENSLHEFQVCALALHHRDYSPYRSCSAICAQREPAVCLYRFAAADILRTSTGRENIISLLSVKESPEDPQPWYKAWFEALKAGWSMIALDDEAGENEQTSAAASMNRASLCFAQQVIESGTNFHPRNAVLFMNRLLAAASNKPTDIDSNKSIFGEAMEVGSPK